MCYDILIVGGGPAGLSAAINGRARGKTVLLVTHEAAEAERMGAKIVGLLDSKG